MIYDEIYRQEPDYNLKVDDKIELVLTWLKKMKPKKILDIGCGRGHYLKHFTTLGFDVTGVEPSSWVCTHDLLNQKVENATLVGFAYENRRDWDALYCMDVLEHIPPDELDNNLEALAELSPIGLIGVANHSDYWNGEELHLIQKEPDWWGAILSKYFTTVTFVKELGRFYLFEVSNV